MTLKPIQFGAIEVDGRFTPGWVAGQTHKHFRLVLPGGREMEVPAGQLLLVWEAPPLLPGEEPRPTALAKLNEWLAALPPLKHPPVDLAALHQNLAAEYQAGRPIPFDAITQAAFGREEDRLSPEAAGWREAALYQALLNCPRLFRRSKHRFVARAEVEIRQHDEREADNNRLAAAQHQAALWRKTLEEGHPPADSPPFKGFLAALEELLAHGRQSPHWAALARPLDLHPHQSEENHARLKHLLAAAGAWVDWGRIWLLWGRVSLEFPPEVIRRAEEWAATPPTMEGRTDYRELFTCSLDSPNTLDFDDAYSVWEEPDRIGALRVLVHIAEPRFDLNPDEPLFVEAEERVSSVYTPRAIYPMLPEVISNGRFSLVRGADREALTFSFGLEETEAAGIQARFLGLEQSIIRVDANLDYDQGEELLARHPATWGQLARLCGSLARDRRARGASISNREEVMIDPSDPERVRLEKINRSGPGHRMVEELAILTNQAAGRYCRDHRLPAIYRVQHPPKPTGTAVGTPPPLITPAARFTTRGGGHAGLACDRYIQVSSPLRRFPDLVMQRQIITHLTGGPPLFADETRLAQWARTAEVRFAVYGDVEKRMDDDWKRVYLAQNPGLVLAATVRRAGKSPPHQPVWAKIWLEDILLLVDGPLPPGVREGDRVAARVADVDVDRQRVRVELSPTPAIHKGKE
ncbi:MAG: RNB domain-containing ribonuclease [Deltaproteobacteria bacterium]|nr:RNB domain-containing ribonuclease [Deltaproteobacteria bacterium]